MILTLGLLAMVRSVPDERKIIRDRRSVNCGQQVMLTHMRGALLHSPKYPMFFEDQNQCMWEIKSFDPTSRIKIFFDDWEMPISPSGGCDVVNLELRELVDGNVANSVRLCGESPGIYVSNGDHISIALQADLAMSTIPDPVMEKKRFALRAELTRDAPRTLATDGEFVVNGKTPLPKPSYGDPAANYPPQQASYPQQPMGNYQTPQQQHISQHQGSFSQQGIQQHSQPIPQQPEQSQYPSSHHPSQYPSQAHNVPPGMPAGAGYNPAVMKSSNYDSAGSYPSYGSNGAPNAYGGYSQNTYQQDYPQYPTYEDFDPTEVEEDGLSPIGKVAIVLFLTALFVGIVVIIAHIVKLRYFPKKDPEKQEDPNKKTQLYQDLKSLRIFREKMNKRATNLGQKVKHKTVEANDKLREQAAKISSKMNSQPRTAVPSNDDGADANA